MPKNSAAIPASNPVHLPAEGFVRLPTVKAVTGRGKSALYDAIRERKFPAPVKLSKGGRTSGWRVEDLRKWIADPENYSAEDTGEL